MTEVLIYGSIYSFSAEDFINQINLGKSEDVTVRINSDGGEVRYGWGMIAKFSELTGKKIVKNDGEANSMGAMFFCYADDCEAIDTATFGFHRAGFPNWFESDPDLFTEDAKADLAFMNKKLRAALEAKIDVDKFNALGYGTVEEMFSMDARKFIILNAKEAKSVGLINRISTITPTKKAEIQSNLDRATAKYSRPAIAASEPTKPKIMTVEQIKAEFPGVYASIFNAGVTEGTATEKDRVEACLTFIDADPKGVVEAIASGKALSSKQMAEFSMKIVSAAKLANIEGDSAKAVTTGESTTTAEKTEAGKPTKAELEAFVSGVEAHSQLLNAK